MKKSKYLDSMAGFKQKIYIQCIQKVLYKYISENSVRPHDILMRFEEFTWFHLSKNGRFDFFL